MKKTDLTPMQVWGILGGGAIMLSLAMGMRQSFGLLQPHMIRDIGITAADFSLAVALQNIVWGATQPIVGIWADKYGTRPVALLGVLIYINGRGLCRWFPGFNHCFANDAVTHYQLQLANGSCWVLGLGLCHAASGLLGQQGRQN